MNLDKVQTVGKFTFLEIYKSKIMINVILSGLILTAICYVVSEFSFGNPAKIALDVGLGLLSLSTKGIAIFFGANLLKKEIESRTIYLILSNPISRVEFLIGKIIGLGGILFLNVVILSIFTTSFYYFWDGIWSNLIAWSILQIFMESLLLLLVVIFFSLVTNINLAVLFSISVYISGYAIRGVQDLTAIKKSAFLSGLVKMISYVIPNFSLFDIKNFVLYKKSLETSYLIGTFAYSVLFSLIIIIAASMILKRKDLD